MIVERVPRDRVAWFPHCLAIATIVGGTSARADAAEIPADPSNYQELIAGLQPGDTLQLAAGTYNRILISGIHGTADAWITVEGPASGAPAIIGSESCCNTVQLYDSSFVAIRNLTIDLQGLFVDGVNAKDSVSHHILIENNTIQNFPPGSQSIVGINTKSLEYHWTIRGNTILEPGTGLYLGGSSGDMQFIAGVVENNLVVNAVGYDMQIKHQVEYAQPESLEPGPHVTIVRNTVFIKDDRASEDGDRPNLLVGGFPEGGPGSEDMYHVYGNLLFHNSREALMQASGRASIHDNIFIGSSAAIPALVIRNHAGKDVKLMHVYNNTFYAEGTAISFVNMATQDDAVVGNLILATTPFTGPITDARDNLFAPLAEAANYVQMPAAALGAMDFYPLPGAVEGPALDLEKFADQVDYDRDYNGQPKGGFTFRGAYAGAGDNPGCPLEQATKDDDCAGPGDPSDPGPGGPGGGGGSTSGSSDGGSSNESGGEVGAAEFGGSAESISGEAGGQSDAAGDENSGCGCRTRGREHGRGAAVLALFVTALRRRARRRR